jgi:hypothetical protein
MASGDKCQGNCTANKSIRTGKKDPHFSLGR